MKVGAVKREVRCAVTLLGDTSQRHGGEIVSRQAVEQPEIIWPESRSSNRIEHAELGQGASRIRSELDAGPGLVGENGALENDSAHATSRERKGRGKSANAAANDERAALRP